MSAPQEQDGPHIHLYEHTHVPTQTHENYWGSVTFGFPVPQGAWWLTPVIPGELRRVRQEHCCEFEHPVGYTVRTRPVRVSSKNFLGKNKPKKSAVDHTCNPSTGNKGQEVSI